MNPLPESCDEQERVVGVSDCLVSADPEDVLVTYSLGSCVGLTLFDPNAGVGGLVHCMLPVARRVSERHDNPYMFVDTGVYTLLCKLIEMGANRSTLRAKVAGAARMFDGADPMNIGKRNHVIVRKILWKNNILIAGQSVGGNQPRTMRLHIKSGRTVVRTGHEQFEI